MYEVYRMEENMNICIIGWYGTETLGDRAILDGIISVCQKLSFKNNYFIGSLYPIVTERTIFEDKDSLCSHGGYSNFECFDIKEKSFFKKKINDMDVVIMGGGPLMDIQEMYIIKKTFKLAKEKKIPTILMGCGYGPLKTREYILCLKKILSYTDLIIMRSKKCKSLIEKITDKKVYALCDPALISVASYSYLHKKNKIGNYLLCNVRDLDYVYNKKDNYINKISKFVDILCTDFDKVILYPMHTFSIGGDDRKVQNEILMSSSSTNLHIINKPLSLLQCYKLISNAKLCVGMRYHAVIFQTLLNGNNYILDYTDRKTGKIGFLLEEYKMNDFYKERYINVLDDNISDFHIKKENLSFDFNIEVIDNDEKKYIELLKQVIREHKNDNSNK